LHVLLYLIVIQQLELIPEQLQKTIIIHSITITSHCFYCKHYCSCLCLNKIKIFINGLKIHLQFDLQKSKI